MIKSLGLGLGPTRFLSGAAILADGRVGLIMNVEEIAGTAVERCPSTANDVAGAPAVLEEGRA